MKFSSEVSVYTKVEGWLLKAETSEELFAFLKKARPMDNAGIVRVKDDATFFEVQTAFQEAMQKAGSSSQLAGGAVSFWGVAGNFADGAGWRMMIVAMLAQPQAQAPRVSLPNGR